MEFTDGISDFSDETGRFFYNTFIKFSRFSNETIFKCTKFSDVKLDYSNETLDYSNETLDFSDECKIFIQNSCFF